MVVRVEHIKPEMLSWAISRAGLNVNDFLASNPDVSLWMEGTKYPTMRQLEEFAKKVHVPFGYLFLDNPPEEAMPIPMFRGTVSANHMNLEVYETVLAIQQRQMWVEEYLESLGFDPYPFVGSMSMNDGVDAVCDSIRQLLGLSKDWAFHLSTQEQAVNELVGAIEKIGVLTAFNSMVGSNTKRPLSVEQCRGFALSSRMAPFIFVNNKDSKNAQVFTLIHEFAHLLLGKSSGYGGLEYSDADNEEQFCDNVAAQFLVPEDLLKRVWGKENWDCERCSRRFKVSQLVMMRRALEEGLISQTEFWNFYNQYKNSWPVQKPKKDTGGPDFYQVAVKRVGRLFGSYVDSAVKSGQLSYTDAYHLTGLSSKSYEHFMTTQL